MLTRDKLNQLSEEELEKLYQQKNAVYDQKIAKNRRIRGLLQRKLDSKSEIVNNLQKKIDDLLAAHPEVAKQDFDDKEQNPEELMKLIHQQRESLSELQAKKLRIERTIAETTSHIERQKVLEERFQIDIESLYSQFDDLSKNSEDFEMLELDQMSRKIQSTQDELDALHKEIQEIRGKIHQQG